MVPVVLQVAAETPVQDLRVVMACASQETLGQLNTCDAYG